MSQLLQRAFEEYGVTEIAGTQHEPRIVAYAQESGFTEIKDDETAWCSIFLNYICNELGFDRSHRADARSWLRVGLEIKDPKPGDVVVFWRESIHSWKGHVGLYLGYAQNVNKIFVLGGNQSNTVSVAEYDANKILGFRRIEQSNFIEVPESYLKFGDQGEEVEKLQLLLNHLGFSCGDVDGDFGPKTKDALKLLQANNRITVDGEYGNQTREVVISLLQS